MIKIKVFTIICLITVVACNQGVEKQNAEQKSGTDTAVVNTCLPSLENKNFEDSIDGKFTALYILKNKAVPARPLLITGADW